MKYSLLSMLMALLLCTGLLAAAIDIPATSEWVMLPLMEHYAPPVESGLPAEEYAPVVEMITRYLQGGNDDFQHIFTVNGTEYAAFNQKEQQHMADVQDLFRLCRFVAWLGWGIVIFGGLFARGKMNWRIFRAALLAILAVVTAVIILACIDFSSLFMLFHQVAFTNDLWLLDPRTDLLIRLMPLEFFISYAAVIGGVWLAGMTAMLVFATIRIRKLKANEGE